MTGLVAHVVTNRNELRAIERRVLHLVDTGLAVDEIGQRFRRSPEHIERMIELAHLPGRVGVDAPSGLRPLERCILGWRARGASADEIGPRLGRSPDFIGRVEVLARHKLANPT